MTTTKCKPYFIAVKFVQGPKKGQIRVWKDYDESHCWGSPLYEVLGYFDRKPSKKEIQESE